MYRTSLKKANDSCVVEVIELFGEKGNELQQQARTAGRDANVYFIYTLDGFFYSFTCAGFLCGVVRRKFLWAPRCARCRN